MTDLLSDFGLVARNLTDVDDRFLKRTRYLIHDRDPLFTEQFREILKPSGVKTVKLPARSPDLNAHAERFVLSAKSGCLANIIPQGERHLRKAVREYTEQYHLERNHQGLDSELVERQTGRPDMDTPVECRGRLGGILKYYHRRARVIVGWVLAQDGVALRLCRTQRKEVDTPMRPRRKPPLVAISLLLTLLIAPAQADTDGRQVFVDARCDRCHAIEAAGVVAKKPRASDLSQVGAKEADWIRGYLLRKQELAGKAHPVAWKGSDKDLDALVVWLASLESSSAE